jgi:DNA-binding NarL/FixJ family response regulator
MTHANVVAVWGKEDVLSSAIEHFLLTKPDWQVVSINGKGGEDAVAAAVAAIRPDILIIPIAGQDDPSACLVQCLLHDHPAIKVILISLEDNAVDVYSRQNVVISQASDLFAMIDNEFIRP